ncbi:hypothetical protein T4A_11348 [Trichinella pseudospiralis]|uniref:Uncharacterized protein n=1 Tax=Trichinella pseudospiralis TaxID=6337 RepID=A0A0V1AQW5_TRIPS|nr:hypothetical protein T4A_10274 [Trichinella pseudospiralis]KRY26953.1 hypothetical protein T4A_11348 [Trichinella pseudospiralis]
MYSVTLNLILASKCVFCQRNLCSFIPNDSSDVGS